MPFLFRNSLCILSLSNDHIAIDSAHILLLVRVRCQDVVRNGQDPELTLILHVPARAWGILHMCNIAIPQASIWSMTDTVFLETSPNSYNSKVPNLWLVFLDSSQNLLNLSSEMTDSVWYADRSLSTNSCISVILPWSSSTASCGIPWFWEIHNFPPQGVSHCLKAGLAADAAWINCQACLSSIFGAGRGVETLWCLLVAPWRDTIFSMQSGWHWLVKEIDVRPCLPKLQPFVLVPWPNGSSRRRWWCFRSLLWCTFFGLDQSFLHVSSASSPKGSGEVKRCCLSSFVSSPLAMSPAWRSEFAVKELPLWYRNSIPSEWNGDMMPFKGAKIQENVVVVLAKLKSSFANQIQRRHVCFLSETNVTTLDPSISNGPHHLILDRQSQDVVPNLVPFSRFCILASSLLLHQRQENHSTSFCWLG